MTSFDFAICLKKDATVQQTFNCESRPMAPEIVSGKPHDMAADVWSFGQLAYHLLCCPTQPTQLVVQTDDQGQITDVLGNEVWNNKLEQDWKDLLVSMVMPDPEQRPKMD